MASSTFVSPFSPGHHFAWLTGSWNGIARAVVVIDQRHDPHIVTAGREGRFRIKPSECTKDGLVFPLECGIAVLREDHGLDDCALQRFVDIVLFGWRPRKPAGTPLIVWQHTVDRATVLRASGRVDRHGRGGVAL